MNHTRIVPRLVPKLIEESPHVVHNLLQISRKQTFGLANRQSYILSWQSSGCCESGYHLGEGHPFAVSDEVFTRRRVNQGFDKWACILLSDDQGQLEVFIEVADELDGAVDLSARGWLVHRSKINDT